MLLLIFSVIIFSARAQQFPEYGLDKIRINDTAKTIVAEIYPVNGKLKTNPNLFYYWYSTNLIHTTQGGYSGRLLNGQYSEYYLNKNLKQEGVFKKGLRDGAWKKWNEDGTLKEVVNWKDGLIDGGDQSTLLQKVNIFKKKKTKPDTSRKSRI